LKSTTIFLFALITATGYAQSRNQFEMMTWVEVKAALQHGTTTALVYNGGTEQRGPQNVNGGHTLIAREVAARIAEKLGNAIVAPVLPFSMNNASAELPGTIGLTAETFTAVNEEVTEQLIKSGFKNVVLMGDHGGGQKQLSDLARKLDAKYASKGIRVVFCGQVYEGTKEHPGAQPDFEKWLVDNGYPPGSHASISDTSEMLYLGGDSGWVRKDQIKTALGDPVGKRDPNVPRVNNGITGDARRSSAELGKRFIDMKVDYAVREIRQSLDSGKTGGQ
jgi:creatinine amidohydrolase